MFLLFSIFLKLFFSLTSPIIYPFVYIFRWRIRTKEILIENLLYKPRKWLFFFWCYLNDSEYFTYGVDYANQAKYYPKWLWNLNNDFLKSWYFNSVRNASINWNNYMSKFLVGKYLADYKHYGSDKNWIKIRQYKKRKLPAIQFFIFGKRNFIGFAKSGRLWIEFLQSD